VSEPGRPYQRPQRSLAAKWIAKFRDAADGVAHGCRTQESLWVQITCMLAVIAMATVLQIESWRWAVLILCIAAVLASELFNSAIEQLVRVLHPSEHRSIALVLHLAAGGVLVTAIGAVIVGLLVLGPPLLVLLGLMAE
jgi:diacylglycerol kinase